MYLDAAREPIFSYKIQSTQVIAVYPGNRKAKHRVREIE